MRERGSTQNPSRVNQAGEFIVASERHRTQAANIDDCFAKLHDLVLAAAATPAEPTAATRARVSALYARAHAPRRGGLACSA